MSSEIGKNTYGSWGCLYCTFLNDPGCKRCKMCGAAKNSAPKKKKGCAPKSTAELAVSCDPLQSTQTYLGKRTETQYLVGASDNVVYAYKRMRKAADGDKDGGLAASEVALSETSRREKHRAASGPWACPACSFENAWLETTCQICLSPRPSVRSDPEKTLHSDAEEKHAQMVCDKQHGYKQKRLEAKHQTNIKTLARLASSSLSPDFVWPLNDVTEPNTRCQKAQNKDSTSTATSIVSRKTKPLGGCSGRGGPKRPARLTNTSAGSEAKSRAGTMGGKNRRVNRSCNQKEASACNTKEAFCISQPPGMLIHYAFQEDQRWVWYKGMILCGWRSKSAWKKVMFEDGEQLWVLLDQASNGRMWKNIISGGMVKMINEFEQTLSLVSPESLTSLKSELKSISSMEAPLESISSMERYAEEKASNSDRRFNIDVDIDDELAIEASPIPLTNWSHPPVVNSLEPTEVTKNIPIPAQLSTPSALPPPPPPLTSTKTKKMHKKRANKQGISLEARRSPPTRGKHREKEKLKKMIKQTISLVSMGNGEEYALPQSNVSEVYTVPTAMSLNLHQRTMSPSRDECDETSKNHWVACDRCQKWRRVSLVLLKKIEASEQRWFCKDNTDDPPLSFCDAEEEVDHTEKEIVDVPLEVPRPAWVLALGEAYTHAFAAQQPPSVYKDCDSLAFIKSLVRNAVGLISPPNTKWSAFLQRMDGCRGVSQIHAQLRMVLFGCHRTTGPLSAVATPGPRKVPRHKPLPVLSGVAEVVPPLLMMPSVPGSGCGNAPYVQSHAQQPLQVLHSQVLHSQVEAINVDLDTSVGRIELSMSASSSKMSPEALLQRAVAEEHWRCSEQWRAWHRQQYQKQLQQQQGGDFRRDWGTQTNVPAQTPRAGGYLYTKLQNEMLHHQKFSDPPDAPQIFLRQHPSVKEQSFFYTGAHTSNLAEATRVHPIEYRGFVPRAPTLTESSSVSISSTTATAQSTDQPWLYL